MSNFDYSLELKEQLKKDTWLRHLFNKLNKEVVVGLKTGEHVIGVLKTIQFLRGIVNLEIQSGTNGPIYFVNWRYVIYLKTNGVE